MISWCRYLEVSRRYNYTTAKSYLELISLFKTLLANKRSQLSANKSRLQSGVEKIAQASAQVSLAIPCNTTAAEMIKRQRAFYCTDSMQAISLHSFLSVHSRLLPCR